MVREIIFSDFFLDELSQQIEQARNYRSAKSARRLYDSVFEMCEKLKQHPEIGRKSNKPNVRSIGLPFDYRMYYRLSESEIEILDIYSSKANPEGNLFE